MMFLFQAVLVSCVQYIQLIVRQWSNGQVLYSQCRRPPNGRDGRKISICIGFVHQVPFEKSLMQKNCKAKFHAEIHDHDIILFLKRKTIQAYVNHFGEF